MNKLLFLIIITFWISSGESQWVQQTSGRTTELRVAYFLNSNTGFILSRNYTTNRHVLLKTINQGSSWDSTVFPSSDTLYNIFFINSNTGWLCGNNVPAEVMPKGKIWKTTNQGVSWSQTIFTDSTTIRAVFFADVNTGYATGIRTPLGVIAYKSTNGGVTWLEFNNISTTLRGARDLYFLNTNTGWIVAANGDAENQFPTIIKTTNGGVSWTYNNIGGWIRTVLAHIVFFNDQTGYAGGSRDTTISGTVPLPRMFKTTNGGVSWVYQDLPTTISPNIHFINGMYFQDVNTGWAVGDRGSISYTSNGGTNWIYQNSSQGLTVNLVDVYFSGGIGWTVGSNGTILKTTNGGITFITPISNNQPEKFELYQNYPNPFNPSTRISFDLPKSGFVKLIVYDALGNEIQTLVDEYMVQGDYAVNYVPGSLASGIYFYRITIHSDKLISGSFSKTHKMLLIK